MAGGILDQDYVQMTRMKFFLNVFRTIRHYRGLVGDAINTGLSVDERLLLGDLVKWGIWRG